MWSVAPLEHGSPLFGSRKQYDTVQYYEQETDCHQFRENLLPFGFIVPGFASLDSVEFWVTHKWSAVSNIAIQKHQR